MHSTFAFGLAKNGVNGLPSVRRAATASQKISGRLSTPSHSVGLADTNGEIMEWNHDEEDVVVPSSAFLSTMPCVASFPIAFGMDFSNEDMTHKRKTTACEMKEDLYYKKRSTSVDKTNPFIGYFQTRREQDHDTVSDVMTTDSFSVLIPSMPIRCVPCRTQSSATLSSMASFHPSTFLTPPKQKTEWFGYQGSGFPPFVKQQKMKQHQEQKHAMLFESLQLETHALAMQAMTDKKRNEKQQTTTFKRTISLPASISANLAAAVLLPIVTSSSEIKRSTFASRNEDSCSRNSRFEQDFEIVGSLGEGGQGLVYKVRSRVDGCYYAVKKVVLPRATKLDARRAESQALREVRSMASMAPHPNVVRYHTAWTEVDTYVAHKSSSMEGVRGSDVSSLVENSYGLHDPQCQQVGLLNEEAELLKCSMRCAHQSYLLESSTDSLRFDECSTPGFTFEDENKDKDSGGWYMNNETYFGRSVVLKNEVIQDAAGSTAESAALKAQVILYIQMELCDDTSMNVTLPSSLDSADNDEPIYRMMGKVKIPQQKRQHFGEETHSNLGAWFRSSLEER